MKRYGLIGHPLGHSFSKDYFTEKFRREGLDCEYENYDIDDIATVRDLVTLRVIARNPKGSPTEREVTEATWQPEGSSTEGRKSNLHCLCGFNVTLPYKESILPYLDELDPIAAEVGAVNTVKVLDDGRMIGYNTDVIGLNAIIPRALPWADGILPLRGDSSLLTPHSSLILGTGGASKAVQYVLRKNNIPFQVVSRNPHKGDLTYQDFTPEVIQSHLLIVNATPVGMAPNINEAPDIPYEAITPNHTLFDLIYNPEETIFLKHGREHGATTINGLAMLHAQAEASWEIWRRAKGTLFQ